MISFLPQKATAAMIVQAFVSETAMTEQGVYDGIYSSSINITTVPTNLYFSARVSFTDLDDFTFDTGNLDQRFTVTRPTGVTGPVGYGAATYPGASPMYAMWDAATGGTKLSLTGSIAGSTGYVFTLTNLAIPSSSVNSVGEFASVLFYNQGNQNAAPTTSASGTATATMVPEPSSAVLLGVAGMVFTVFRRRRTA